MAAKKRSSKKKRSGSKKKVVRRLSVQDDPSADEASEASEDGEDKYIYKSRAKSPTRKSSGKGKKRFALIREFTLADFITMGNAICGTSCIFLCLNYLENSKEYNYLYLAFILLPCALICDLFDGYVARCRNRFSPYGADLDSLADLVSFGVAPAVLGFTLGLRGIWDSIILCYFVCCGISRLARYNVTWEAMAAENSGKVKYYEGTPIPFSVLLSMGLWVMYHWGMYGDQLPFGSYFFLMGYFHPFSLVYVALGTGMISTFHIPKL